MDVFVIVAVYKKEVILIWWSYWYIENCMDLIPRILDIRNQTGMYERTLHDCEIDATNNDESFEIMDEAVG